MNMLRKRVFISSIITLLFLVLTNNFWLVKKPVDLQFELTGADNISISYKLHGNVFSSKMVSKDFDLKISPKIKISNNNLIFFNKVETLVDTGFSGGGNLLKASIPTLRRGKYKLSDLNKFKVVGATISQVENVFYITPQSPSFKLIYPVKGHASVKFEFEIFVILLVLSYLLTYKLVDYLADFKTLQNKSRIEIIFLTLFFVMLFIPLSYITQEEISQTENRTLAKWKPLITDDGKINYNFGKDYDKWYNDRFYARDFLLNLNDFVQKTFSINYYRKNKNVLNRRNNWICREIKIRENLYTQEELNKALNSVKRVKEFCEKNNIKLYILAAASKEDIYHKEVFNIENYDTSKRYLQMKKYLEKNTGVPVILAYPKLRDLSKKEFVYFKTDHHWTDSGAYEGYLLLMNQIKKDFPNIYINKPTDFEYFYSNKVRVSPNDFYEGRTYKVMNLKDKSILDTSYKYFKHKDMDKIQVQTTNCENGCWERVYKYNKNYPNIYFYGDSFTLNLLQMLPFSFNTTKNIYIPSHQKNSNLKFFEDDIVKNKPDILVLCFEQINRIERLYKGEK